jgi:hypothetical protein
LDTQLVNADGYLELESMPLPCKRALDDNEYLPTSDAQ